MIDWKMNDTHYRKCPKCKKRYLLDYNTYDLFTRSSTCLNCGYDTTEPTTLTVALAIIAGTVGFIGIIALPMILGWI
jgi:uncharacterized protein (DUF983 family)